MAPTEPQSRPGPVPDGEPPDRPHHTAGCGCGCDGCTAGARAQSADTPTGPYRGWTLVAMASFYFLLPVIAGVVGAVLAGPDQDTRALAGLGCFALALVVTAGIARLWLSRSHAKENQHG